MNLKFKMNQLKFGLVLCGLIVSMNVFGDDQGGHGGTKTGAQMQVAREDINNCVFADDCSLSGAGGTRSPSAGGGAGGT